MPQAQIKSSIPVSTRNSWKSLLIGYVALALIYHAAEYAMRLHQHIPLFLGLMLAVLPVAYGVARLQGFSGLGAWGLQFNRKYALLLAVGLGLSLLVNGIAFLVRLWFGIEVVTHIPAGSVLLTQTLIFTMGTFLPSLAEDVLTRGYLFGHLKERLGKWTFVFLSSAIYVLNHIYALDDGPAMLIYLFVIGVMLAIPLVYTRNLWYTVGAHWAGNIVYRFSNDVLKVEDGAFSYLGLWELTLFILLLAVVNYWVCKRVGAAL